MAGWFLVCSFCVFHVVFRRAFNKETLYSGKHHMLLNAVRLVTYDPFPPGPVSWLVCTGSTCLLCSQFSPGSGFSWMVSSGASRFCSSWFCFPPGSVGPGSSCVSALGAEVH